MNICSTNHLRINGFLQRYRKGDSEISQYIDVPPDATTFQVEDLSSDERYTFSIRSINVIGESEYVSDIGEVRTKGELVSLGASVNS